MCLKYIIKISDQMYTTGTVSVIHAPMKEFVILHLIALSASVQKKNLATTVIRAIPQVK